MNVYVGFDSLSGFWREYDKRPELPSRAALTGCFRGIRDARSVRIPPHLFGAGPVHVCVPDGKFRTANPRFRYHVCSCKFPRNAWLDMGGGLFVASPELYFLQMAQTLSCAGLVLLGLELCGTYRLEVEGGFRSVRHPLATARGLGKFVRAAKGMPGRSKAQRALRWVMDGSASPMESMLAARLCMSAMLGGYGLPLPALNELMDLTPCQQTVSGRLYLYGDLLWLEQGVLAEYDGEEWHSGREKMEQDAMRANAVSALGLQKFTVTASTYFDFVTFDALAHEVRHALGLRRIATTDEQVHGCRALVKELCEQEALLREGFRGYCS